MGFLSWIADWCRTHIPLVGSWIASCIEKLEDAIESFTAYWRNISEHAYTWILKVKYELEEFLRNPTAYIWERVRPHVEWIRQRIEANIVRIGFVVQVRGSEAGTKGIALRNFTTGTDVASVTWSGTAWAVLSAFADVTLTGANYLGMRWYASSATEDLTLRECMLILIRGT